MDPWSQHMPDTLLRTHYLRRIASVGSHAKMRSQHNYLYGPRPYMLLTYDQVVDHQYLNYLKSVSMIDVNSRRQIQSAIHWYGTAISEDEPTVSYVAAWTGLECIGPLIDKVAHPKGSKVQCDICCNIVGQKRRKYKAGITHMFNRISLWAVLFIIAGRSPRNVKSRVNK